MPLKDAWRSIKLSAQKLDTLLLNDLKLFFRDKKSLILVVLTPFLILAILINIYNFSNIAENMQGVKVGLCDEGNANLELKEKMFDFEQFKGNCEKEVAEKVERGELRGAIVIPEDFRQNLIDGRGTELTVYVDNTKSTTALVTSNAVKAYAADLNQKMGEAFIREAWKNLDELNDNLRIVVKNLKLVEPIAKDMRTRMSETRYDLEKIDFERYQKLLDDMIHYLDVSEELLNETGEAAKGINPDLTLPKIQNISQTNTNTSTFFSEYRNKSAELRANYCNSTSNNIIPMPTCILIDKTDQTMITLEQKIGNYYDDINQKIAELNAATERLQDSINKLGKVLDSSNEQNKEMRRDIADMRQGLLRLQEKTDNVTESIIQLDKATKQFLDNIVRVTNNLETTIGVLDTYTKKDPATILRPVTVEVKPVFKGKTEIFNRLPGLMAIVLLFIMLFISSSQIVGERKSGTMARIYLSPISMFFFVFEKIIYLLLLGILSFISMIAAVVMFGVPFRFSGELVIIAITASLAYISIGILIGALSKTENTSLLTCLVVGFPLMFLSGAFSAPELMSKMWRVISNYLPLTINVNLWEKVMIYNTGIDKTGINLLLGITIVFYLLAVWRIRTKPTVK